MDAAVEQDVEEVRRVGEVHVPAREKEPDAIGFAGLLEVDGERDLLDRDVDADLGEVGLDHLAVCAAGVSLADPQLELVVFETLGHPAAPFAADGMPRVGHLAARLVEVVMMGTGQVRVVAEETGRQWLTRGQEAIAPLPPPRLYVHRVGHGPPDVHVVEGRHLRVHPDAPHRVLRVLEQIRLPTRVRCG